MVTRRCHARAAAFPRDAGIDVLELGYDQRVDAHAADARLETATGGGTRSPILSVAFTPSTERTWGACSTLVRASLSVACNRAPGRVVEKSELARCASWSGMELPVEVELVVAGVVAANGAGGRGAGAGRGGGTGGTDGTWMLERGVKAMESDPGRSQGGGDLPAESVLASSTRNVHYNFGAGLVQIVDNLLHEGHAVASHLAMMAFCAL